MKIGDLQRRHQVWRVHHSDREGTSTGPDSWLWCTRCGDVRSTEPWDPGSCACGNIVQDIGRLDVESWDELVELATSTRPDPTTTRKPGDEGSRGGG